MRRRRDTTLGPDVHGGQAEELLRVLGSELEACEAAAEAGHGDERELRDASHGGAANPTERERAA